MSQPDVSVVIVNWNGGELLMRCLRSLRQSRTSFKVEVIVVDNASADGSREVAVAAFPEFRIVNSGQNLGFGRGNNLARSMVKTPLVLFLNPDTEVREDTLERAVQCLREHADVGMLGCKMRYPTGEVQEQGLQWELTPWTVFLELLLVTKRTHRRFRRLLPVMDPNRSGHVIKLYGGFLLVHKEILDRVGWFDDRYFMYAEDADLCRTILARGWKLYYCSEAEIIHVSGGVSGKTPSGFAILMKHQSIGKLMRKYHGWMGILLYRAAVFGGASLRLIALLALRVLSAGRPAARTRSETGAVFKHRTMLLWALGLKRPAIAKSSISAPAIQPASHVA